MSNAWSWYVIALVTITIIGCVWLLISTARRRPGDPQPEETSHVWDGDLTEYNKPLPRWWINLFVITIVFSLGYLFWYPGLGNLPGSGGWTSSTEHNQEKAVRDAQMEQAFSAFAGKPVDRLAQDPRALELGRSIFANTCTACHGSAARGASGYPNLTDEVWIWGGQPEQILASVLDGRTAVMPPQGEVLKGMGGGDAAIPQVVAYVRALRQPDSAQALRNDPLAARGKVHFEGLCAACHGPDAKGNPDLGAPNLTAAHPLFPNTSASITKTIVEGRQSEMPAHRELLGETRSRLVAAYVWSLSHPATSQLPTSQ